MTLYTWDRLSLAGLVQNRYAKAETTLQIWIVNTETSNVITVKGIRDGSSLWYGVNDLYKVSNVSRNAQSSGRVTYCGGGWLSTLAFSETTTCLRSA